MCENFSGSSRPFPAEVTPVRTEGSMAQKGPEMLKIVFNKCAETSFVNGD